MVTYTFPKPKPPTLADIPNDAWLPDGETFSYKGKLYRLNPDFTITEVEK